LERIVAEVTKVLQKSGLSKYTRKMAVIGELSQLALNVEVITYEAWIKINPRFMLK
jgi:hypothetical protein